MELKYWKKSGFYYKYKGYKIFCKEEGEGIPLLLIHGFPTSSWDWSKIWIPLTQKYKVITLDMIGYGFSDKPKDFNYTIAAQVDLWEMFLKDHQVMDFHILSHDFGDTVVQEMLARLKENPDYEFTIRSVCFLNGGMFPETNFPTITQKLLLTPLGGILKYFMGRNTLAKNFRKIFGKDTQPTEEEIDQFWETIDCNKGKEVIPRIIKYLKERDIYKIRWREAIQYTAMPKRLINGGADPISGKHMAVFYKEIIPNADVVVLEDIGHYPQTEAPEEVLKHYIQFRESLVNKS